MKVAAELRLKHGELYLACQRHGGTRKFAEKVGVGYQTMCNWLAMRKCPQAGVYRGYYTAEVEARLVELTGSSLAELFPAELRAALPLLSRTTKQVLVRDMPVEKLVDFSQATVARLTTEDPAEGVENADARDTVRRLLADRRSALTWRERSIIELRYGLGDGVAYTLEEVGYIFQRSRDRIRQLENKALRKLSRCAEQSLECFKPELPPNFYVLDAEFKQAQTKTLRERVVARERAEAESLLRAATHLWFNSRSLCGADPARFLASYGVTWVAASSRGYDQFFWCCENVTSRHLSETVAAIDFKLDEFHDYGLTVEQLVVLIAWVKSQQFPSAGKIPTNI